MGDAICGRVWYYRNIGPQVSRFASPLYPQPMAEKPGSGVDKLFLQKILDSDIFLLTKGNGKPKELQCGPR